MKLVKKYFSTKLSKEKKFPEKTQDPGALDSKRKQDEAKIVKIRRKEPQLSDIK